jgi:hypothetical protein
VLLRHEGARILTEFFEKFSYFVAKKVALAFFPMEPWRISDHEAAR